MDFGAFVVLAALAVDCASGAVIPSPKTLVSRNYDASNPYANWPSYEQLPLHPSFPSKAAWGVWGADDVNGALNHITNATILAASQEIKLGKAFNLNLELDIPDPPINPSRKPLSHLYQPGSGYTDDVIVMNTQISTQYDGLRHFPYSTNGNVSTYQWYNDLISDYDEVIGPSPSTVLGIQQAAQKGIAGRGVLLDYAGWAEAHNITVNAFTNQSISVADLDNVAAWQGLDASWARPGDILFVRTGWVQAYNNLTKREQQVLPLRSDEDSKHIGILASDESGAWFWEKKLALVGADNPAFEAIPFAGTFGGDERSFHQIFIGGWGQSIVEFLDLEALAKTRDRKSVV